MPDVALLDSATVLRIGRTTVYALMKAGDLRPVHIGRSCRLSRAELDRYVRSLQTSANAAPTPTAEFDAARSPRRRINATPHPMHARWPFRIAAGDNAAAIHRFVATVPAPGAHGEVGRLVPGP